MQSVVAWVITYAVHSTVLLGAAWLATRALADRPVMADALWKGALVAGVITATLQVGLVIDPLAGQWSLASDVGGEVTVDAAFVALADETTAFQSGELDWMAVLLLLWGLGAAWGVARICRSWRRLSAELRARRPASANIHTLLADLTTTPVRVTISDRLRVPVAMGLWRGEICLPRRANQLSKDEQRALLAHEMAHLDRADPAWRIVSVAIEALLFFQPLNRLAAKRLQRLSETLADDWAVAHTGRPIALARCLTDVASWTVRSSSLVPAMTNGPSQLSERVRRLLAPRPESGTHRRGRLAWSVGMLAAIALMVFAAPGASAAPPDATQYAPPEAAAYEDTQDATDSNEPQESKADRKARREKRKAARAKHKARRAKRKADRARKKAARKAKRKADRKKPRAQSGDRDGKKWKAEAKRWKAEAKKWKAKAKRLEAKRKREARRGSRKAKRKRWKHKKHKKWKRKKHKKWKRKKHEKWKRKKHEKWKRKKHKKWKRKEKRKRRKAERKRRKRRRRGVEEI